MATNPQTAILQSAINQLEAQKVAVRQSAYDTKYAELKPEFDNFAAGKKQELNEAIMKLNAACEKAIEAKKAELKADAEAYASVQVIAIENNIAELKKMAGIEQK